MLCGVTRTHTQRRSSKLQCNSVVLNSHWNKSIANRFKSRRRSLNISQMTFVWKVICMGISECHFLFSSVVLFMLQHLLQTVLALSRQKTRFGDRKSFWRHKEPSGRKRTTAYGIATAANRVQHLDRGSP